IQSVSDSNVLAPVGSTPGIMKIYKSSLTAVAPTLSGVSPTTATAGSQVTITGSGFTGATSVKFNAVSVAFTVIDDGRIIATVPTGSAGSVPVTVTNAVGTSAN